MSRFELLAMRHGDAEDYAPGGGGDDERALTERGHDQAATVGRALRALGLLPTAAVSSPYRRACQTARDVIEASSVPLPEVPQLRTLVPEAPPRLAIEALLTYAATQPNPVRLLAVWHNPSVTAVLGEWVAGQPRACFNVATADFAHLWIDTRDRRFRATVIGFYPYRSLAALGGDSR